MDWDKLRIFHAAAEAGSFTHAGEALRMSQSAVSRQVSALEKELKVSLFHRHARGLVLTEIDPPTLPILFVYPEELKSSKKVQVLRDFLVAKARQWKD